MSAALTAMVMMLAAGRGGPEPVGAETVIAQLAADRGGTYVLTPPAAARAREDALRVWSGGGSAPALCDALRLAGGLECWDFEGVTVWFTAEDVPAILAADARSQAATLPRSKERVADRRGALDLEHAAATAALDAVSNAFSLVVVADALVLDRAPAVTVQVDGIGCRTALAIVAESLGVCLELHGEVVLVTNRKNGTVSAGAGAVSSSDDDAAQSVEGALERLFGEAAD